MSAWHDVHAGGANPWGVWQLLQALWLGPLGETAVAWTAWQLEHRVNRPARPPSGGAACGAWHWAHVCRSAFAAAASGAWQPAQGFVSRSAWGVWQPAQAPACGEEAGHADAVRTSCAWQLPQRVGASLAGRCASWHDEHVACLAAPDASIFTVSWHPTHASVCPGIV
jgi:hypothetical protein